MADATVGKPLPLALEYPKEALTKTQNTEKASSVTQVSERLLQPEDKLQGTVTLLREEQELQPEDKLQGTVTLLREEQELQPEDKLQGTVTLLREEQELQPEDKLQGTEEQELQPEDKLQGTVTLLRESLSLQEEDGDILKKEITAVKEELHLKHQTILGLKEQLQNLTATALQRPQPATSNTQLTEPRPSTSSLQLQPSPQPSSSKTSPNPTLKPFTNGPAPQHEPQPSTSYQLDNIPPSTIKIKTDTEATDAEVIILIDSNGKFLDEEQLFPGQKVKKIWCPRTDNALDVLTKAKLGEPSHIIVHTGTNNLRIEQERVAESVTRVALKATQSFPNSKITVSTILPRRDFHPLTIHRINSEGLQRMCCNAQCPPGTSPHPQHSQPP
ncbi:Reticulocyte-binding protein 2 like a [Dissostichus eleginoides]|uniref:Reticulocyte-binding protein 2 like a n=1 Tax=Dissostichus eleginoides TaxID=100907 RepID=A0AAD9C723_DISEL|nr:Reticulocyte-binding protein 2 like a [Dissostichus eleginoides]